MVRIAVIGAGAAGFSAVKTVLKTSPDAEIVLFNIPDEFGMKRAECEKKTRDEFISESYRNLKSQGKRCFPPVKSVFGSLPQRHEVCGRARFWKSTGLGGLTNVWGGAMRPFSLDDMTGWPEDMIRLRDYYSQVANWVGISGPEQCEFCTLPALNVHDTFLELAAFVNSASSVGKNSSVKFAAAVTQVACETRAGLTHSCNYCGECLVGCHKGAVFSTAGFFEELVSKNRVTLVTAPVWQVSSGTVVYHSGGSRVAESGFDNIFLCAGCIGTLEILIRSDAISQGQVLLDNPVYQFPIIAPKGLSPETGRPYFALSNLLLSGVKHSERSFAIQLNPSSDFLVRAWLPETPWKIVAPAMERLRHGVIWARMYLHSDWGPRYEVRLDADSKLEFKQLQPAEKGKAQECRKALRQYLHGSGYYVPSVPMSVASTSSHLSGGCARSEIMPDVFVCDAAAFPTSPAGPPTFSVMAHASRIVTEVLR